jgi:hypothetical protein
VYHGWYSRFYQPDPWDGSYDLTDPQSFNRYSYVQNDPVNFVDPSGLMMEGGVSCYIDGIASDCGLALRMVEAGAAVIGPASTLEYNHELGTWVRFVATANGSGWIPVGARYLGGLSWGWTDYSREDAPSYTYTLSEDRLSRLVVWGGQFAIRQLGGYYSVYGERIGEEGGIEMNPAFDPVWIGAGILSGGLIHGLHGGVGNIAARFTSDAARASLISRLITSEGRLITSATVARQLAGERGYIPIQAILTAIGSGVRVSDPQGVAGRFMYTVPAVYNRTEGFLEVLVNETHGVIEHVLFFRR